MNTTTLPLLRTSGAPPDIDDAPGAFREPAYESQLLRDAMKVVVYIPGVEAAGVDIEGYGPDLTVTARKSHVVRVNFDALHLEHAQRDYRLRLRLGRGFDYSRMAAEIADGVLTIRLPKRTAARETLPKVA